MISRRHFMQASAGAAAFLAFRKRAYAFSQSPRNIRKFITPLQGLGPTGIPVAASDGVRVWPSVGGVPGATATHYTIDIRQYTQWLHPDLPIGTPTTLWGYGQNGNHRHLGGLIVAKKNTPVQITFRNFLPNVHPLPVDFSTFFPDTKDASGANAVNKTAVHLHGGYISWISDGGPYDWFRPAADGGAVGPSFLNNQVLRPGGPFPGEAEYYYSNQQSARLMWYHDHAHDLTRLNAYAGIASGYLLRDDFESLLIRVGAIPNDTRLVPIIFQDKIFNEDGSLFYPSKYEGDTSPTGTGTPPARWAQAPGTPPITFPSCIPEMFGDTILVNGTVYPYLQVEPRRYRFMFLNACNARVLNLQLYIRNAAGEDMTLTQEMVNGVRQVDSSGVPIMVPTNSTGPEMIQIGNEAGFLFAPAVFDTTARPIGYDLTGGPVGNTPPTNSRYGNANRYNLLLGGAERADVLIDFNGLSVGTKLILYSDAPAPFPAGDNRNDYFFGQPDFSSPAIGGSAGPAAADAHGPNGYGPNSRTLMQIEIVAPKSPADMSRAQMMTILTQQLRTQTTSLGGINSAPIRDLTLNEDFDQFGRLVQMIGTDNKLTPASPTFGRLFADPPSELVTKGTKEIWRIWNMTGDTHPIPFHLVNVQVLGRAQFDGVTPHTEIAGTFKPADANENGWKETVRMNPGEVIYLIMKFELPITPFVVPGSPRLAAMGFPNAHEYVYHCHILEHEEHDMMRTVVFT